MSSLNSKHNIMKSSRYSLSVSQTEISQTILRGRPSRNANKPCSQKINKNEPASNFIYMKVIERKGYNFPLKITQIVNTHSFTAQVNQSIITTKLALSLETNVSKYTQKYMNMNNSVITGVKPPTSATHQNIYKGLHHHKSVKY